MKALILAAGYATRLYPLTKDFPKPLLEVAGKPIIDYIVEQLNAVEEIDEIFVVTNHKFFARFAAWKKSARGAKRITLVDDLTTSKDDRRGAIGDMDFVLRTARVSDGLLVVGADNLFDGGLRAFAAFAAKKHGAVAIGAFDIKHLDLASQYGVLKVNARARVVDFKEKPKRPDSTLVAMCLYYFPKGKLGLLHEYLRSNVKCDATGLYIDWLQKREAVYAYVFRGRWYDIGRHDFYKAAQAAFLTG